MPTALERLTQLRAEMAELEKSAAKEIAAKKETALHVIVSMMIENEVTLTDLETFQRQQAARYTDGKGNTWSGKGKRPGWLTAALHAGKKLEDFKVEPAIAQREFQLVA